MPRPQRARSSDIDALAMALPEVTTATAWGDRPAYQVKGRTFVLWRGPRKDALDEDGERLVDVIMFAVPGPEEKAAMLASGPPWFTTAHFDGYNAVLVREGHLEQVSLEELREVVEDAWLAKAPKRLVAQRLSNGTTSPSVQRNHRAR